MSTIKVDTIQTAAGGTPTAESLGITIPESKLKQTIWLWDDTQASIPNTTQASTGLEVFNYDFTAASDNPHFVLDLSLFIGRNAQGNDAGDVHLVAWIEKSGTMKYPFGFYKTSDFRASGTFRTQTGNYLLEDSDAGQYSDTADWGAMRWTYAGVMGNQSSELTLPTASSGVSAGDTLTLRVQLGGSGTTHYNRTANQTQSMSRSWGRLQEISGDL